MKPLCLVPIALIVLNKHINRSISLLELIIILACVLIFILQRESKVVKIEIPKMVQTTEDQMEQHPMTFKPRPLQAPDTDKPIRCPKLHTQICINSTLDCTPILIPKHSKQEIEEPHLPIHTSSFLSDQRSKTTSLLKSLKANSNSANKKLSVPIYDPAPLDSQHSVSVMEETKLIYEEIFHYYKQLNTHKELVKLEPKIPGARTRIIVEPGVEEYKKTIVDKIEAVKEKLKMSKTRINNDLKVELKSVVSQITSDINDIDHLNQRVAAILGQLRQLSGDELSDAIYVLCEEVVQRGQDQADSIDVGPNFAHNFTNFILSLAKSYPVIHEIYYLAVIKIKPCYFPMFKTEDIKITADRSELKDLKANGVLGDPEKDKLTRAMDVARAYAFLLGTLFASKESNFNEGDIWRWLSFVLNLPVEHIDRVHLPMLLGFLKTAGARLKENYKGQFEKLAVFLKGPYLEVLKNKFGKNPYLKAYITQLREVINKL